MRTKMEKILLNLIEECGEDVWYEIYPYVYVITIRDYEDYDEELGKFFRDYEHTSEMERLMRWLNKNCNEKCENWVYKYTFDTFVVIVRFRSDDI